MEMGENQLQELQDEARRLHGSLSLSRPLFVEFAGTPKSGKSTCAERAPVLIQLTISFDGWDIQCWHLRKGLQNERPTISRIISFHTTPGLPLMP